MHTDPSWDSFAPTSLNSVNQSTHVVSSAETHPTIGQGSENAQKTQLGVDQGHPHLASVAGEKWLATFLATDF